MSGRRSARPPFPGRVRLDVVLGAEAAVNVVIDHAVVLHERVHARGLTKRYPCDFSCLAKVSAWGVEAGR
jgi:hypothetical protein